jgi:hypothetical protein
MKSFQEAFRISGLSGSRTFDRYLSHLGLYAFRRDFVLRFCQRIITRENQTRISRIMSVISQVVTSTSGPPTEYDLIVVGSGFAVSLTKRWIEGKVI